MLKLILACLLISSLYTIPLNGIPLGEVSFGGEFSEQRTVANSYGQVEEAKPLQVVSFNDIPETTVAPVIVEESTTVGGYSAEVITQAPLEFVQETTTVFVPPPMLESTTVYGEYSTEVIPELTGLGFPGVFVPSMLETTTAAYGYAQETTTVFVPPPILETTTGYYASETTTVFVPPPMLESTTISYGEYAPTTLVQVLAASVPVIETTTPYAPETKTVFATPPMLETNYYAVPTTVVPVLAASAKNY